MNRQIKGRVGILFCISIIFLAIVSCSGKKVEKAKDTSVPENNEVEESIVRPFMSWTDTSFIWLAEVEGEIHELCCWKLGNRVLGQSATNFNLNLVISDKGLEGFALDSSGKVLGQLIGELAVDGGVRFQMSYEGMKSHLEFSFIEGAPDWTGLKTSSVPYLSIDGGLLMPFDANYIYENNGVVNFKLYDESGNEVGQFKPNYMGEDYVIYDSLINASKSPKYFSLGYQTPAVEFKRISGDFVVLENYDPSHIVLSAKLSEVQKFYGITDYASFMINDGWVFFPLFYERDGVKPSGVNVYNVSENGFDILVDRGDSESDHMIPTGRKFDGWIEVWMKHCTPESDYFEPVYSDSTKGWILTVDQEGRWTCAWYATGC